MSQSENRGPLPVTASTLCSSRDPQALVAHGARAAAAYFDPHRFATGSRGYRSGLTGQCHARCSGLTVVQPTRPRSRVATPPKFQSGWKPHALIARRESHASIATKVQEHSAGRETTNNGQCPHRNLQSNLGMIGTDGAQPLGCGWGCNIMRPGFTGTSSDNGKPARRSREPRSEEHTAELQSRVENSHAVFFV